MQEETKKIRRSRPRRRTTPTSETGLPNLFFCGDPHGGFDQINEAARLYHPDAMIILGDMQLPAPMEQVFEEALAYTDIYWIPGNHDSDTDQFYDNLWRSRLGSHNLHGRVINVCGMRIAGLGGVFRGQVWMPDGAPNYPTPSSLMRRLGPSNSWRGGVPRRHRTTIFPSVYRYLLSQKADILVSHEAPSCHKRGFNALDDLAKKMGVNWIFHGHQHEDRVYDVIHDTIKVRAVGYRGVVNLAGEVIIPAQLDPREAAGLGLAFEQQTKALEAGEIIVVRDEDGRVSVVSADEELEPGLEPAIIPASPEVLAEQQAREKARNLGREVAKRAPGGRWRNPRPKKRGSGRNRPNRHGPKKDVGANQNQNRRTREGSNQRAEKRPQGEAGAGNGKEKGGK